LIISNCRLPIADLHVAKEPFGSSIGNWQSTIGDTLGCCQFFFE